MPKDKRNSRLPDVSFIRGQRRRVTTGSVPQIPDLAVEIKSPIDSLKGLRAKAEYYIAHSTRLVWIVDPARQLVIVLTPDSEEIRLSHESLDGGEMLPGFTLPLRDILADPLA
jgi:Uma2 family endonuclease